MLSCPIHMKIIRCLYFAGDASWDFRNLKPFNTLYYVLDGDGHLRVNGEVYDLLPGHVYLLPAHMRFDSWCDSYISKVYCDVHVESIPGFDIFASNPKMRCFEYPIDRIEKLKECCSEPGIKSALYIKGEIYNTLSEFVDEDVRDIDRYILELQPIINEIKRNLSPNLKTAEIAEQFGWNASVLSRKFKKYLGCTLKAFIDRMLLHQIQEELLVTTKSIKQIAFDNGFCDQYYLSAFFRKYYAMSPTVYRCNNGVNDR